MVETEQGTSRFTFDKIDLKPKSASNGQFDDWSCQSTNAHESIARYELIDTKE
eukprot:m.356506 g.356506  ORF g.356506 m.356506 type:complete len:53 (+) comp17554_c0_seq1:507-665(+)